MGRRVVLLLPLVLLSSCFSYQEETWVEKDGSGRTTLDLFVADGGLSGMGLPTARAPLEEKLGVQLDSFEVQSSRHGTRLLASFRFAAPTTPARDGDEPFAPPHAFRWEKAGSEHHYVRNVLPLASGAMAGVQLPAVPDVAVAGFRYRSTVHFPGPVRESSGTAVDRRTVRWELSVADLLEGRKLVADVRTGIPWGTIGVALLVVLAGMLAAAAGLAGVAFLWHKHATA